MIYLALSPCSQSKESSITSITLMPMTQKEGTSADNEPDWKYTLIPDYGTSSVGQEFTKIR